MPSRLAQRSQTALTTAAVARWMTPFSGPEPAQLRVGDEAPPEAAHVGDDALERAADDQRLERPGRGDADLGPAPAREGQAVTLDAVVGVRAQDDVRGRVVGIGVHRVRAVEPARRRKANVARFERRDRRRITHACSSPEPRTARSLTADNGRVRPRTWRYLGINIRSLSTLHACRRAVPAAGASSRLVRPDRDRRGSPARSARRRSAMPAGRRRRRRTRPPPPASAG